MPKLILFDNTHNEMLNVREKEFSKFQTLLRRMDLNLKSIEGDGLEAQHIRNADLLIIGNPIDNFFSSVEVKIIIDFVRTGGSLFVLSEYGADFLQKTNLNDIVGKFGIKFEKDLIKEINSTNQSSASILHIHDFQKHELTKQLREIRIGGACSLSLSKEAKPIFHTIENSWPEIYNTSTEQWIKEEGEHRQIIAAYNEFGKGKVVALGDIDIFSADSNIGLKCLDNEKFIQNVISWLLEPVKEPQVLSFVLDQLGDLQYEIRETNKIINNIIETMTILEKRLSYLENHTDVNLQSTEDTQRNAVK
ncbi:MAG: DUF4350 domain-containing protein [Promethearchaeota archaeon]|jgi:hypothetical protein